MICFGLNWTNNINTINILGSTFRKKSWWGGYVTQQENTVPTLFQKELQYTL